MIYLWSVLKSINGHLRRWPDSLGRMHGAPYRGYGYVPLRFGGNVGWSGGAMVLGKFPVPGRPTHRRRKRGGQGGQAPPIIWEGGPTYPLAPPNNPPTSTGKTIPLNSILEFSIILYFKMRNVIIWHWFIKNLVGTRRRNDVDATSLRRIDVVTTSCAYWEFGPPWPPPPPPNSKPWPPQYSKPSYAYATNLDLSGARAYCACNSCGWGLFGHFFSRLSSLFFFLPLFGRRPDWNTVSNGR